MNIFVWVWFSSRTENISSCTKDISSVIFWYFYNIFASKRLIVYRRRYSSGSVDILSRPKIFRCSKRIWARTKDIFVQQKNFSKYSSVTTSSAAEEFRKIFFSVHTYLLLCLTTFHSLILSILTSFNVFGAIFSIFYVSQPPWKLNFKSKMHFGFTSLLHSKKQSENCTTPKSYSPWFQLSTKSKILFK
jgi:hypothetical protein